MNLADLLHDAVEDVEPVDRLDDLRARTSSPAHAARPWWWAAGGVVVATAATVAAFAVVGGGPESTGPAGHDHHGAHAQQTMLVAAYFVGDTPAGPRLFREFDEVPSGDALEAALERIQRPPSDPDYRTSWTATSFGAVEVHDDVIHVELGDAVLDDDLAVQQVVYTLQAAAGERLPVQLADASYVAAPQLDVLGLVSISDPAEGTAYQHDTVMVANGRASSFEATVPWELRGEDGEVVRQGFATADGWQDRLHPWRARVDLADLLPGFYTFVATTADPAGGAEESLLTTDTRTIIVR
ncbi:Gmad2 immunoglobulin-like domain-containing protein [Nocardioides sp. YIM 152315]|uniref:Gmad2 immunoglobulin-like domain-containing protein n=1 Tax=Nocardioides sp. YIM 152315 TaxID=3031760 RepID=UPI0023D9FFE7|nr:Gmad2 immunoglobulin-like domain-containing protein [Nocardioides sp. YIM 152315]MDF1602053.1 Gmad2 immunoglobulin-like domain-containing protein [Nocardioides sp. YIM 152315]